MSWLIINVSITTKQWISVQQCQSRPEVDYVMHSSLLVKVLTLSFVCASPRCSWWVNWLNGALPQGWRKCLSLGPEPEAACTLVFRLSLCWFLSCWCCESGSPIFPASLDALKFWIVYGEVVGPTAYRWLAHTSPPFVLFSCLSVSQWFGKIQQFI